MKSLARLFACLAFCLASTGIFGFVSPADAAGCATYPTTLGGDPAAYSTCSGYSGGYYNRVKVTCQGYTAYGPWKLASSSSSSQFSFAGCNGGAVLSRTSVLKYFPV